MRRDIYQRLSQYLAGQSRLADFHNWFIPAAWNIDSEPDPVKRVAYRIQLLLAEYANGHRSEDELRSEFWGLMPQPTVTIIVGSASVTAGSSSVTKISPVGPVLQRADKVSEVAFESPPHLPA